MAVVDVPVVAVVAGVGIGGGICIGRPLVQHWDRDRVGNDGSRTLGISAVGEIAELPAQVIVEVGGDGFRVGIPRGRPLSIVTVTVAKTVRMSVVAVTVQMTIPVA